MLTLLAGEPGCLCDDPLPVEVKQLPEDLPGLGGLLSDEELLWPLVKRRAAGVPGDGPGGSDRGEPDRVGAATVVAEPSPEARGDAAMVA